MPEVGDSLGRYTLLRRLAVGGMGEVFVAAKPGPVGFGPYVALKVLRDELACDPQFVDMLVDEANISMFLNHQNVVTVLDLGEDRGSYYIAMEYVQGITVERIVESLASRGKKLAIPVALYMGTELCRALKYAHTRVNHTGEPLNIVHRDVTPANILLSVQGEVKLTDFGIARAKGRVHQTQAGVLKGKFGYMAPEMVRYERIDARADLFCAGVCLYLMLAGQHPVAGAAVMEAIQRYEEKRIAPPSSINPAIPATLDAIVMRCLEPKVENRWASAAALGDALQDVLLHDAHWRTAAKDGARLVAQQIREVAPECFDAPVSAEQTRHLLERARADRGQRRVVAPATPALGRERLVQRAVPAPGPRSETSTEDNLESTSPQSSGVGAGQELDLPTATSLPAITPDMDFAPTPAVGLGPDQETDEQLQLHRVRRALEPDTDEQNAAGNTEDSVDALDDTGAVPSAPADATMANPVVSFAGPGADAAARGGRRQGALLEEPSLPDPGPGAYAARGEQAEATVAQFHYDVAPDVADWDDFGVGDRYGESEIDRPLAASTGEDGATVVNYAGEDVIAAQTLSGPPGVLLGEDPDAATIIPTGPELARMDAAEWRRPPDDGQDATLLDGIDAHEVQAALEAAKAQKAQNAAKPPRPQKPAPAEARFDTGAMDAVVRESLNSGIEAPLDPASVPPLRLNGPIRIPVEPAPRAPTPPPWESSPPPWATAPAPSRSPPPAPAPRVGPAARPVRGAGTPAPEPEVGANTGRWMAGQLEAGALSWDDEAAARRAVATRNQGGAGPTPTPSYTPTSTPPSALPLPGTTPAPGPGFLARNGVLLLTIVLTVALLGGGGYAWLFTQVFWPKLKLDSVPSGAAVLVDGQDLGRTTPLVVQVEPEHQHLVEVRLAGYRPTQRVITDAVARFRNYTLMVELERGAYMVHLPAEGTVFLNGAAVATGQRVELSAVPEEGPITLRVEAKGYQPYEYTFPTRDDLPASLDVPLTKM